MSHDWAGAIESGGTGVRLRYAVPLAVLAAIETPLGLGLTLNPSEIPSSLIGRPIREFPLPSSRAARWSRRAAACAERSRS
jgi:hypothetical protein